MRAELDLPVQMVASLTVVDEVGRPVPGARITGRTGRSRWSIATQVLGQTDARGRWSRAFVSRPVRVRAAAAGYVQSDGHELGGAPLEIVLAPGAGSVSGQVLDGSGVPVPDAAIALVTAGEHNREAVPQGIRSDEDGRFRYGHLPPGPILLVAAWTEDDVRNHPAHGAHAEIQVQTGHEAVVELREGAGTGAVRVTVVDETGAPDAQRELYATPAGRTLPPLVSAALRRNAVTDARGEARLTGLVPGAWQVVVDHANQHITRHFEVVAGETAEVLASRTPTSPLTVRVQGVDREPRADLVVRLDEGGGTWTARTDREGVARFDAVAHGDHRLAVHAPDGPQGRHGPELLERPLNVRGPQVEDVLMETASVATVSGQVESDGRIPLDELEVQLTRMSDNANLVDGLDTSAATGTAARFAVPDVPPGDWVVGVRHRRRTLAVRPGVTVRGDAVDVGTLNLGVGTTELELTRRDGAAVRDAILLVRFGNLPLRRIGIPPQNDRIRLVDMPSFVPEEAVVWGPGVAPASVELRVVAKESLTIPVVLDPATPVTFRLPGDSTAPVRTGTFTWTRNGAPFVRELALQGEGLVRGLPPGAYEVVFEEQGEERRSAARFEVGDEPLEVTLELR